MARVTVVLPKMLAEAHGKARIEIEASTVQEAIDSLFQSAPALKFHLWDESGRFRFHVMCFLNDDRVQDLSAKLRNGDRIAFIQAISGG